MRRKQKEKKGKTSTTVILPKKDETLSPSFPVCQGSEPRPPIQRTMSVDESSLPAVYNNTKVTLIARDPYWIHAYWEIAPRALEALRNKFGSELDGAVYALRMYDVTCKDFDGNNANHWFDIVFSPPADNWYISLWNDNVSYCAEIGLRAAQGRFHPLARSNFVTTPPVNPSGRADVIWMKVEESERPFIFREMKMQRARALAHPAQPQPKQHRKVSLTEEDVRAYYSSLFPLLRRVGGGQKTEREETDSRADRRRECFLAQQAALSADGSVLTLSKEEIKRLLSGSSESLLSGASEKNAQAKPRNFYFEIGTELIVYGRTEPDAAVWLGDKKIALRGDGTFTLRFALPDNGNIPLDFTAVSADKAEKRKITTGVKRSKTVYL